MNDYRYALEPYKTMKNKHHCPNCNKKTFTRYIDNENNEHINDQVGKCSRLIKCKYHFTPKQYFKDNDLVPQKRYFKKPKLKSEIEINFINAEILEKSISTKYSNFFIDYLASIWNYEEAYYLAEKYNIGTSKYWKGATVFWQVDIKGEIRTGKIMLYDAFNGSRVKKPYNHINWVHTVLRSPDFNLEQCFFGEHLLNEDNNKPIAIVESEKTAIISSVLLPDFIWIACGSVNNLNEKKTRVLKGRNVVLFPDLGCFDLWNDKIPTLTKLATFRTSSLLEDKSTDDEKGQGLDIVDYMINLI
jgi:hypothetical protein